METGKEEITTAKEVNIEESQSNNNENLLKLNKESKELPFSPEKIDELRQWMKEKGCIIHPSVEIPSFINGYQGVATTQPIPPRTLIIAVPSSLILTVTKCYKDPQLKSIFTKNDELFDYESSDDAEFNVLCVFMMYHKLNIETSPWRIYLETIGEPETAIDWEDRLLKGLNKSVIEEIIHVRIECDKLREELSEYLKTTKQFNKYSLEQLKETFDYCYRAVMTRCFGYYFGEASLIPIADLINHGCEVVDHQLVNVKYEKGIDFNESYKEKSDKIDLSILGIKRGKNVSYPYREKFLIENNLIESNNLEQELTQLNREKMNSIIEEHNERLFRENKNIEIEELEFCSEDDSEDNDTDVDEQHEREMELERLQLEELEQIENFKKYHESIKVETFKEVEERFNEYEKHLGEEKEQIKKEMEMETYNTKKENVEEEQEQEQQEEGQSRNDMFIKEVANGNDNNNNNDNRQETEQTTIFTEESQQQQSTQEQTIIIDKSEQSLFFDRDNSGRPIQKHNENNKESSSSLSNNSNIYTHNQKAIVPIKLVEDSESEESEDDEEWGLEPESYFTLSTGSGVAANKELFNSYGSRTNRFLLIWYGFCYRDNLFDSVSLRLHVQFNKNLPKANSIVLDTYVGGQGLSFRKNEKEVVYGNEVSREFRLKENKICMKLLTFLRLYLLDYYKGKDLYKICVTIPSSIEFELFVLNYYKEIIMALYERYPLKVINELKQEMQSQETLESDKVKIHFKIIYLEEQRRILDANVETVDGLLAVWQKIKEDQSLGNNYIDNKKRRQVFNRFFYQHLTIKQLKKTKPYLKTLKNNYPYVIYHHQEQQESSNSSTK